MPPHRESDTPSWSKRSLSHFPIFQLIQYTAHFTSSEPSYPRPSISRIAASIAPSSIRRRGRSKRRKQARSSKKEKIREEDFYEAFGEWLINELEECTRSISVGGSRFKDKWGTPDVIGVREARRSDIIKPPTEIVSAEIKLDPANLITAFGQACSYRIFSHKSYIVVPDNSSEDDIARLDALSRIFGIGLVIFNPLDPKNPDFKIRSRAAREEPDMFYVNKYLKLVEDELFT